MNLQQLEYIVAVDNFRHFATAAEKCFVTQPTLSMMIRKLEEELDIQIFDRSRQPVVPTEAGEMVIAQARAILSETARMKDLVHELKGEITGEIKIGVIPTIAPYLLPLFLPAFLKEFPGVRVKISENTTEQIVEKLKHNALDAGILATPLGESAIIENPLFYEQFVVYSSRKEKILEKNFILQEDIDVNHLWLLEEGHCLRAQVMNLCSLRPTELEGRQLDYEAGSIETLKKMVNLNDGTTIIPELSLRDMDKKELEQVRYFQAPAPVREISLVTYRLFTKRRIIDALCEHILAAVPEEMKDYQRGEITNL
ncbi:MAG: LysR substrate-binding domain-containing protein [Flavobacteriales bacterium]|jgi:LysR family hydrogen peroxide-inducible transcriptional activator